MKGVHGEQMLNNNGRRLRELVDFSELKVTITFYRKKAINKYTLLTVFIDYITVNQKLVSCVMDGHEYRGKTVSTICHLKTMS